MADLQSPGTYKQKMKLWVISALAACTLFFAVLYIPDEVLKPLSARIETVGELMVKFGLGVSFAIILSFILFAQDHLATGNSRASVFFRHYYPSTYAVEVKRLKRAEADRLWFDYFNQWESEHHKNNEYCRRNFERTYACRLIFYLKRIFGAFIVLALLSTLLQAWVFPTEQSSQLLVPRLFVLIVSIVIWISLLWSNRIGKYKASRPYEERYSPTGAYKKYKEIAGILREKFQADVLSKL